jgi:hypothetical protein
MSSFDKIENAAIDVSRKLFDNQIDILGKKTRVARVRLNEDKYGDEDVEVLSKDEIECIINYPSGGVPLGRKRSENGFSSSVESSHVSLWDILPIELYTKWSDNVEKGDILVDFAKDENGNYIKFVLQITETVGEFRQNLTWKKNQCAPYNYSGLPKEIVNYIEMLTI